jgi:hypothetical protein
MTEKEKYLAWFKKEQEENGLLECRIIGDPLADFDENAPRVPEGTTEEDIYRAMNAMNDAIAEGRFKIATDL